LAINKIPPLFLEQNSPLFPIHEFVIFRIHVIALPSSVQSAQKVDSDDVHPYLRLKRRWSHQRLDSPVWIDWTASKKAYSAQDLGSLGGAWGDDKNNFILSLSIAS
jgi:hypothetical protein